MTYVIHVTYYFYAGTFNTPRNGLLRDDQGNKVRAFPSHADAVAWLVRNIGPSCGDNLWATGGDYVTDAGEYAPPTYSIRRQRKVATRAA